MHSSEAASARDSSPSLHERGRRQATLSAVIWFIASALVAQTGDTPVVLRVPGVAPGSMIIPEIIYRDPDPSPGGATGWGHYYYNSGVFSGAYAPLLARHNEFRIIVLQPTSPAPNGAGIVSLASGGFVSGGQSAEYYERLAYGMLMRGYTVFVVTHGSVIPESGLNISAAAGVLPQWTIPEIRRQVHSAARAIRYVSDPAYPSLIAGFQKLPLGLGASGGSSGAGLALDLLARGSVGKSLFTPPGATNAVNVSGVDSSCVVASVQSAGGQMTSWRGSGDNAFLFGYSRYSFHPDLSAQSPPVGYPPLPVPSYADARLQACQALGGLTQFFNPPTSAVVGAQAWPAFPEPNWVAGLLWPWNSPSAGSYPAVVCAADLTTPAGTPPPTPTSPPGNWAESQGVNDTLFRLPPASMPTRAVRVVNGDADFVVPPYQFTQLMSALGSSGAFAAESWFLPGEGHGWLDTNYETQAWAIEAFERWLVRGTPANPVPDRDLDGVADAVEPTVASILNPDIDGDGASDLAELLGGTSATDPTSLLEIVSFTKVPTPGSTTSSPQSDFVIQFRGAPGTYKIQTFQGTGPDYHSHQRWVDAAVPQVILPGATGTTVSGSLSVTVQGSAFVRVCRVAGGASRVASAPIAQTEVRISRSASTARWNYLSAPTHKRDFRASLISVTGGPGLNEWTLQLTSSANGPSYFPVVARANSLVNGVAAFVAVVARDQGRVGSPTVMPTKPSDHGREGDWWSVVSSTPAVNSWTVVVTSLESNPIGLTPGSEISVRETSSLADLVGPTGSSYVSAGSSPLRLGELVYTFNRVTGVPMRRYGWMGANWVAYQSATPPFGTTLAVTPDQIRILPDEVFGYFARSAAPTGPLDTVLGAAGFVPMSDIAAYLRPGGPVPPAANSPFGNRMLRSWPYPVDAPVGQDGSFGGSLIHTVGFVESGLTTALAHSIYYGDPSLGALYTGDDMTTVRLSGEQHPMPDFLGTTLFGSDYWVLPRLQDWSVNGVVVLPPTDAAVQQLPLRAGRGYFIATGPMSGNPVIVWRRPKPYRRPD